MTRRRIYRPNDALEDRRSRLRRRLLERPHHPPWKPPERWREHHGQRPEGRWWGADGDMALAVAVAAVAARRIAGPKVWYDPETGLTPVTDGPVEE